MAQLIYEIKGDSSGLAAASKQAVSSINTVTTAVNSTNKSIQNNISSIRDLQAQLKKLNQDKINIVDSAQLAKQNALIQELEAEITRFSNVGKAGFDSTGIAIKGFGKNVEEAQGGIAGFGKSLTGGLTTLRQLAYILPGIGIAGIFNLAFIGIAKAAEALDLFSSKVSQAQSNLSAFNAVQKDSSKQIGDQVGPLQSLYDATQNITLSIQKRLEAAQQLRDTYPAEFANTTNLAIVNGDLKKSYDELTASIIKNAIASSSQKEIAEQANIAANAIRQIQKIRNAQSNELARVKAPTEDEILSEARSGGGSNSSLADRIRLINKNANDAISKQQDLITNASGTIKFLETFVKDFTAATSKLDNANKLLGDNIDNFNSLIAKATDKKQFENIKDALQTKLDSLAPNDPQIQVLRAKIKQVEEIIKNAYDVKIKTGNAENIFANLSKQLDEILAKSAHLADQSGLTGYALEVQKINDKYKDLNRSVDEVISKAGLDAKGGKISQSQLGTLNSKAKSDKSQLAADQAKELSDLQIKEAKRVSDEIQRINDEFGIKSEQSREKEIQQIQARYDAEVKKAEGNKEILTALDSDRAVAIQAINDKYLQRQQDLQDKIAAINQQANADITGITESATGRIVKEWESRRQAADKYYQQLQLIIASELKGADALAGFNVSGLVGNAIKGQQSQTNTNITNAENTDVNREILKPFTQGITEATRGIVQFFSTFNQQTDQSFRALFTGLVSQVENVFNRIFEGILDKELQNSLINGVSVAASSAQKSLTGALQKGTADGTKHLSSQLSAGLTTALAGVGLLGSAISGLTPKTSVVGQGAGGLLQGAASGALIGSVIPGVGTVAGAIIGGGIGLLSGIFGASKAQKELQAQQLEQQKEQLAATKASLAYTSSIIGRMTAQGLITGVDVSSSGQLVARVSGRDLQFILDRNGNGR